MPLKLVQLSRTSQNPPLPKPPQSRPASNTQSRVSPSSSSQLPTTQPVPAKPTRKEPKDNEKDTDNPEPQEKDDADYSSESSVLTTISEGLDKALSEHRMSNQLKDLLGSIQKYITKAMIK
jgi:hypothetical protein